MYNSEWDAMWDRPAPEPDAWKQESVVREQADRAARERAAEASRQRQREEQQREIVARERNAMYDQLDSRNFVVKTDHLSHEIDRRYAADPSRSDSQIKDQMCREYAEGRLEPSVGAQLEKEGHVEQYEARQTAERQRQIDEMKRRQAEQDRDRQRGNDLERGR
jgi:hypothetical protein